MTPIIKLSKRSTYMNSYQNGCICWLNTIKGSITSSMMRPKHLILSQSGETETHKQLGRETSLKDFGHFFLGQSQFGGNRAIFIWFRNFLVGEWVQGIDSKKKVANKRNEKKFMLWEKIYPERIRVDYTYSLPRTICRNELTTCQKNSEPACGGQGYIKPSWTAWGNFNVFRMSKGFQNTIRSLELLLQGHSKRFPSFCQGQSSHQGLKASS